MSGWAAAITSVYDELSPLGTGNVKVYDHEPGNPGWRRPQSVVVSLGRLTPTEYGVTVRVYQSTNTDVDAAQTALTDLVDAVEAALGASVGDGVWQTVWLADENAWVCSTELQVGREDF